MRISKNPQYRGNRTAQFLYFVFSLSVLYFVQVTGADLDKEDLNLLEKVNFMVGVAKIGAHENNATKCGKDFATFLDSVTHREVWALKLIDSFGNVPKSFIWGNYFWFPKRELCDDINDPLRISISPTIPRHNNRELMNSTSPFEVHFQVVFFNFTTPMFVDIQLPLENLIHVGVCVPTSCAQDDIVTLTRYYFGNKTFETQKIYDIEMHDVGTKNPKYSWNFLGQKGVVMLISVLFSILTCCCLAEIIERLHARCPEQKNVRVERNTPVECFLLCFSLRQNMEKIMQPEDSHNFLPVIAGLRTIVCFWVTLFHVYYYSLFAISNVTFVFSKLQSITLQPVTQACFYVDIFFVISAFLLVNNFLSNTMEMQKIKKNTFSANMMMFLKFLVHRYFRIMPVFFITMVASDAMYDFIDLFSPFNMNDTNGLYCKEHHTTHIIIRAIIYTVDIIMLYFFSNWWYNALFIHNFRDLRYICSSWSWYLGCEMQFFLFAMLLLFIYAKNENLGKFIYLTSALSFVIVSFCCNYYRGITFQNDIINITTESLYVTPWIRIVPYFGGLLMGWLYFQTKSTEVKISDWKIKFFWTIGALLYFSTIFMTYWKSTPVWCVSAIMSFGKLIFSLYVGALIILCQHGYGGAFNTIMSSKLFLHLNKFCFSLYMLSPVIIVTIFGVKTEATAFDEISSGCDLITIIVVSLVVSFISLILVEIPFQRISNKFIIGRR